MNKVWKFAKLYLCQTFCYGLYTIGADCYISFSITASPSDSLAELLAFIKIRDQPHVSRSHRVANLNLLAKVSEFDWVYHDCVAPMCIL